MSCLARNLSMRRVQYETNVSAKRVSTYAINVATFNFFRYSTQSGVHLSWSSKKNKEKETLRAEAVVVVGVQAL